MCEGRRKTAPLALPNVCASCRLTAKNILASLLSYLWRSVGSLRQLAKVVEFRVRRREIGAFLFIYFDQNFLKFG